MYIDIVSNANFQVNPYLPMTFDKIQKFNDFSMPRKPTVIFLDAVGTLGYLLTVESLENITHRPSTVFEIRPGRRTMIG